MKVATTCLEKVKRAAINGDWDRANDELQVVFSSATEEERETIVAALGLLAADCEKINLTEVALWAYQWVAQIAPCLATPYLRLAIYYDRTGQRRPALEWLQRGMEMAVNDGDKEQLYRVYRRVKSGR